MSCGNGAGEERIRELIEIGVVRDDDIGADADETLALPLVDGQAIRFVRSNADGNTAHLLHVLDLNVPVAEAEEFVAGKAV